MAYDEGLAQRIEDALTGRIKFTTKKMFGGLAFLMDGNMVCGVSGDGLMARVGADNYEAALAEPNVELFGPANRPMTGWVLVTAEGIAENDDLQRWLDKGLAVAAGLPPK